MSAWILAFAAMAKWTTEKSVTRLASVASSVKSAGSVFAWGGFVASAETVILEKSAESPIFPAAPRGNSAGIVFAGLLRAATANGTPAKSAVNQASRTAPSARRVTNVFVYRPVSAATGL